MLRERRLDKKVRTKNYLLRKEQNELFPFNSEDTLPALFTVKVKSLPVSCELPFQSLSNKQFMLTNHCYLRDDELPHASVEFMEKNTFNIITMNCQSIRNKINELREMVTSLHGRF